MYAPAVARRDDERQRVLLGREGDGEPDHLLGQRQQRELGFQHDAQRPLAADEPVHRIVRERVAHGVLLERGPPQLDDRAVGQRDLERAHVRPRCAVAERARTRGVARDGAAERALLLARGIRGEQEPVRRARALQLTDEHSRLGAHRARDGIEIEHTIHRAQRQHDPLVADRGAGGARLTTRARHRGPVRARLGEQRRDLGRGGRPRDPLGNHDQSRCIRRVRAEDSLVPLDGRRGDRGHHAPRKCTTVAVQMSGKPSSSSRTPAGTVPSTLIAASASPPCASRA